MVPAVSYDDVCRSVASLSYGDHGWNDPPEATNKVTMVGLLFASPHAQFAKNEIVPRLKHFHYRSGRCINFYCAGYTEGWPGKYIDEKT